MACCFGQGCKGGEEQLSVLSALGYDSGLHRGEAGCDQGHGPIPQPTDAIRQDGRVPTGHRAVGLPFGFGEEERIHPLGMQVEGFPVG